ncbi:hypothetical protein HYV72_02650 [Candidatus Uhrbacteria bacterium]|nr:hypothetical protein [Candidatus Uhrbacteria bacterium]
MVRDRVTSRIALLNAEREASPLLLFEEATTWQWVGEHTFLFADQYAIHLFDTDSHTTDTVTRLSEPLTTVHWFSRYPGYVWYATQTDIFAVELDGRDGHRTVSLAHMSAMKAFGLDARGRTLLFAGQNDIDTGWFTRPLFTLSPENQTLQDTEIPVE